MKLSSFILTALISTSLRAANPDVEAFAQKFAKARTQSDAATLEALHYTQGSSEADIQKMKDMVAMSLKYSHSGPIKSVTIEALDEDAKASYAKPQIFNGEKIEVNLQPLGMIKLTYEIGGASMSPYAIVDGKPWLVGPKVTKLNWNGSPEDRYYIGASTPGDTDIPIKIECTYKASGEIIHESTEIIVKKHGFATTSINAHELISVVMTTKKADVEVEGSIRKDLPDSVS